MGAGSQDSCGGRRHHRTRVVPQHGPAFAGLTGVYGAGRLDLLAIPPESLAAPAGWLMAAANPPDSRKTASAVLLAEVAADPGCVNHAPLPKQGPFDSLTRDLSPALTEELERQAGGGEIAPARFRT